MLTRAALKNPYAVFALCMIALILGGVSYQKMRVDIFPEIKLPSILVTTFYRGLSPSEMEGAITFRLEQRFVEASYVEHIESQSLAGMSYIKVFFQPDYGIDAAQSELTSLAYSVIRTLATRRLSALRVQIRRRPAFRSDCSPSPAILWAPRKFAIWPTSPCAGKSPASPEFHSALRWAGKSVRSRCFSISNGCSRAGSLPRRW